MRRWVRLCGPCKTNNWVRKGEGQIEGESLTWISLFAVSWSHIPSRGVAGAGQHVEGNWRRFLGPDATHVYKCGDLGDSSSAAL